MWKWSWNGAGDISTMSNKLCDEGLDVDDGDVTLVVEESARGKEVSFRVLLGKVDLAIGRIATRLDGNPESFALKDNPCLQCSGKSYDW